MLLSQSEHRVYLVDVCPIHRRQVSPTGVCYLHPDEGPSHVVRDHVSIDAVPKTEYEALKAAAQAVVDAAPVWGRTVETSGAMQRLRSVLR